MPAPRILVTGGSGVVGHWVIRRFLDEGYDVVNVDSRPPAVAQGHTIQADLTDLGQVVAAFSRHATGNRAPYAGVVHLAAVPRPFYHPNNELFRVNALSTYNVLEACGLLGIPRAVIASSECSYGFVFAHKFFPPRYLPVDEDHPQCPEDSYALSKVVNEATARMFHQRDGTQIVSLRIGNVVGPDEHEAVRATFSRPEERMTFLWSYIDARDLAEICQRAIERGRLGCQALNVTADDVSSDLPTATLIRRFLPTLRRFAPHFRGHETLLANDRVRKVLGWKQRHFLRPRP